MSETDYWTRTLSAEEILALGREHADLHNLPHWKVRDAARSLTTAGWCKYRERVLELNCELLRKWPYREVLDVVLHEIAHAKVGSGHGHGRRWKEMAERVGADPSRCYPHGLPKPDARWIGTCLQGHEQPLVRQPARYWHCRECKKDGVQWPENVMDFRHVETGKRPDGIRYTREFRSRRIWEAFREAYADGTLPPHFGAPHRPYEMLAYDGSDIDDEYFVVDIHAGRIEPLHPDDDIGEAWWQ